MILFLAGWRRFVLFSFPLSALNLDESHPRLIYQPYHFSSTFGGLPLATPGLELVQCRFSCATAMFWSWPNYSFSRGAVQRAPVR